MSEKKENNEISDIIKKIAKELERNKKHFTINVEEKIIGTFVPAGPAKWIEEVNLIFLKIQKRLQVLEEAVKSIKSQLADSSSDPDFSE